MKSIAAAVLLVLLDSAVSAAYAINAATLETVAGGVFGVWRTTSLLQGVTDAEMSDNKEMKA